MIDKARYTSMFEEIAREIDVLMQRYIHTKQDLGYGCRRRFENGMWFDLIDYTKTSEVILRVSRGAWLVKQYPMLAGWFDEVKTVIAKCVVTSSDRIEERHLLGVLELLDQAPRGVGVR